MKTKQEESKFKPLINLKSLKLNKTTMVKLQGGANNPVPGIGVVIKSDHPSVCNIKVCAG